MRWDATIWVTSQGDIRQEDRLVALDPVEAEAYYLTLCQRREADPTSVVVAGDLISRGRYQLAREHGGPRESDPTRYAQMWAAADQGWVGPTPEQLRGLVRASGLSGSEIARRIGVTPRAWRRWLADPSEGQTRIPYAAWVAALRVTGMLPDGEHARREDRTATVEERTSPSGIDR
ncbi:MAG: helix-turn-helix transcriptional regulator [Sandaracinaceae bacterium]